MVPIVCVTVDVCGIEVGQQWSCLVTMSDHTIAGRNLKTRGDEREKKETSLGESQPLTFTNKGIVLRQHSSLIQVQC